MGLPVCGRLVEHGHEVAVADADPAREPRVRDLGAAWHDSNRGVARAADVLLTILPGTPELVAAMAEALPALEPGSVWIDLTSSTPATREELGASAAAAGVEYLEAPMGGGPPEAATGDLQLFVGATEPALAAQRPLLETLGRVEHMGGPGQGYAAKLLVNLLWFGQAVAVGEALLVARRAGMDLDTVRAALLRSPAASRFIERDLDKLLDGDYLTTFGLDRCCEELDAAVALAGRLSVPAEVSSCVAEQYAEALRRFGPVDGELLAVALKEETAGTVLRRRRL